MPAATEPAEVLVAEMRAGRDRAWSAFLTQYRPVLVGAAHRLRIPHEHWDVCIDEVLVDEARRLARATHAPPRDLAAYLIVAARHKWYNVRRAAIRRRRRYEAALEADNADGVVTTVCSSYSHHASLGRTMDDAADPRGAQRGTANTSAETSMDTNTVSTTDASDDVWEYGAPASLRARVLAQLTTALVGATTAEERTVLLWVADGMSHRQIGAWLGISYAAAAKRIWRIRRRLRIVALRTVHQLAADGLAEPRVTLRLLAALGVAAVDSL